MMHTDDDLFNYLLTKVSIQALVCDDNCAYKAQYFTCLTLADLRQAKISLKIQKELRQIFGNGNNRAPAIHYMHPHFDQNYSFHSRLSFISDDVSLDISFLGSILLTKSFAFVVIVIGWLLSRYISRSVKCADHMPGVLSPGLYLLSV